jgi:hypothetical protein
MKTFRSLRENQLDEISRDTTISYATKAHAKYDTLRNKKDSESTAKKARLSSGIKKANLRINPQLKDKPKDQQHHIDMSSPKAYYASKSAAGQHYVGDSVELEGEELFEGHYEDADEHMSKANDAHSQGDMLGYHSHMSNHHDSMSQWHEEKGRGFHADKHAEKADMHADKMHDLAHGRMTEAKSAEIRMYNALQKARQDREKADAEKERLRKGGEELLNPVKRPAPLEPVKEGLFDFLSHPSGEKKKPKLDYNAVRQSAQVRNKAKTKVFNGPEEYNRAKSHNFAEEVELEEGTFKYHMDKAIAADQRGDTKKKAQHLENARTAKFAMKSTDYAKNSDLLAKHRQMSEEVEQIDEISRTTAMKYVKANQEDDAKKMNDPTKRKNPTFTTTVIGKHNKGVSKNTIGFSNAMARISGHKPTTAKKPTSEEVVTEEKPGLYANIHAKQRRIKNGSGEHMRKPGSKGAPTAKAFKQAQKTVKENIDAGIEEGLARLISKSIKNVAAVKPTPQQKADIRLNHLNK